jgi:predicted TIM-barrel fold metal-dependent hydrolase
MVPQGKTRFSVSNDEVLAWCRKSPGTFLFGASVHPHRHDALEALEWCAQQGAVLIKWLPNYQGIDPAARRHPETSAIPCRGTPCTWISVNFSCSATFFYPYGLIGQSVASCARNWSIGLLECWKDGLRGY